MDRMLMLMDWLADDQMGMPPLAGESMSFVAGQPSNIQESWRLGLAQAPVHKVHQVGGLVRMMPQLDASVLLPGHIELDTLINNALLGGQGNMETVLEQLNAYITNPHVGEDRHYQWLANQCHAALLFTIPLVNNDSKGRACVLAQGLHQHNLWGVWMRRKAMHHFNVYKWWMPYWISQAVLEHYAPWDMPQTLQLLDHLQPSSLLVWGTIGALAASCGRSDILPTFSKIPTQMWECLSDLQEHQKFVKAMGDMDCHQMLEAYQMKLTLHQATLHLGHDDERRKI